MSRAELGKQKHKMKLRNYKEAMTALYESLYDSIETLSEVGWVSNEFFGE